MTLPERLRWATAPDPRRSAALLWGGFGGVAAAAGAAVWLDPPAPVAAALLVPAALAWIAGCCGAIGYVRWMLRRTAEEIRTRSGRGE